MEDKIITIVITAGDYGDVSFQDEYSAKVFDNIYRSMYEECGIVDLRSDSEWHDYRDNKSSAELTHTLRYFILEEETKTVVEMLKTIYDVIIIDIQFEEDANDWDSGYLLLGGV